MENTPDWLNPLVDEQDHDVEELNHKGSPSVGKLTKKQDATFQRSAVQEIRTDIESPNQPSWVHDANGGGKASFSYEAAGTQQKQPAKKPASRWKQDSDASSQVDDEDDEVCCCCPTDPVLFAFRCFHLTTGCTGLAAIAVNVYSMSDRHVAFREVLLRSYAILFCVVVVFVELDWRFIVKRIKVMDLWLFRGLFYTFVGFMTFGATEDTPPVEADDTLRTPQAVTGIVLASLGVVYMLMGICCLKSLKMRRRRQGRGAYSEIADGNTASV